MHGSTPDESLVVDDVVQESFRGAVNDEVVCERPRPCRRHPRVQRMRLLAWYEYIQVVIYKL